MSVCVASASTKSSAITEKASEFTSIAISINDNATTCKTLFYYDTCSHYIIIYVITSCETQYNAN